MLSAILIDDERASLIALEAKLQDCKVEVSVIGRFQNPVEALEQLPRLDPDVIFLDVDMPQMDGFMFLKRISNRQADVVFTTAYNQYAIDAIRAEALDFLLKPVIQAELCDTLQRLQAKRQLRNPTHGAKARGRIAIPTSAGLHFAQKDDILYVLADRQYTTFYLANQSKMVVSKTLKEFEELLEANDFFRIHHGAMVNLSHVVDYIRGEGGSVLMTDGAEIEVSRRRKQAFLEHLL